MFIAASREKYSIKELPIVGAHSFGYNSKVLPNINIIPCWKGCQAGISAVGIQSNGGVKGCLSLPEEFIEGNIREKNLEEIWNDSSFCSYNREFKIDNNQKIFLIFKCNGKLCESNIEPYCYNYSIHKWEGKSPRIILYDDITDSNKVDAKIEQKTLKKRELTKEDIATLRVMSLTRD